MAYQSISVDPVPIPNLESDKAEISPTRTIHDEDAGTWDDEYLNGLDVSEKSLSNRDKFFLTMS
jgi:hypothetical protein